MCNQEREGKERKHGDFFCQFNQSIDAELLALNIVVRKILFAFHPNYYKVDWFKIFIFEEKDFKSYLLKLLFLRVIFVF